MITTKSKKKCNILAWGTGAVFGHACPKNEAKKLIKTLLDGGINLLDTGPSYSRGKSQTLLANCLNSNEIKREDILISTKIGSMPSRIPFGKTKKSFSKLSFEKLLKKSLYEFQTDYLDILFLHGLPKKEIDSDALDYFISLKSQGKVRYLGVAAHTKKDLNWTLKNHHIFDVVMCHYNLLNYKSVESYLEDLKKRNITIIGSSPFSGGLLSSRKRFREFSNLKSDIFYTLKELLLTRQRKQKKEALKIMDEISTKSKNQDYPLEFSLKATCIDITIFGSLSKESIFNSTKLLERLKID